MARLLIVEDDAALGRALAENLRYERHEVVVADTGEEALRLLRRDGFDLLLLDLMLPGISGFEVLRQLGRRRDPPRVLVLSARDAEADIVRALDLGAQDYVRKPFGLSELLARVRAQLRDRGGGDEARLPEELTFADVRIALPRYRLWKSGREHLLSHTEARLLELFLRHPEIPLSRRRILREVWGEDAYPTERTVDNFILKLRRKLEDDPASPRYLRTLHGVGYCFTPGAGGGG